MIQQTTRTSIRGVNWTDESPRLWEKLSDCGGLHFSEILASVNTAEVRQIASEVELISHNCESSGLLKIELRSSD